MFKIHYYTTVRGEKVVEDFIFSLSPKTQDKVFWVIDLLSEYGPMLRRPYADSVQGKIRELRIRFAQDHIRILYFFFRNDTFVLLHSFRKTTKEVPLHEIKQAERNMSDFMIRYRKGEEML